MNDRVILGMASVITSPSWSALALKETSFPISRDFLAPAIDDIAVGFFRRKHPRRLKAPATR
ncbi:MAG: hypothetical protein U9Q71_07855 [Pseudomonadota bacterium]|nr:hypothetical protein [Pseudomonadota bacterium]